ncbi:hypothetical protein Goari_025339 [Gossypium aridum]|uniref:Uncharacterized protein n=1 Tax=Gossypium aridum TaxID=34290 RepID=A0A7J8X928_GOSAI|nr:hypothetical protein [Gossypium aridum]
MESLSWKRDFLIKWKIMRSYEYGLREHNKKRAIA